MIPDFPEGSGKAPPPAAHRLRVPMPLGALLLGLALMVGPSVWSRGDRLPAGPQDGRLVHFSLEHAMMSLAPGGESLWDPPVFFPASGVASFTDTLVSLMPFYGIWRALGLSPNASYLLWFVTVLTASFAVALVLFRRGLRTGSAASTVGAFLLTFGSPRIADVGHPQMVPWLWPLAALACFLRVWKADNPFRQRSWLAATTLCLVFQAHAAFYPLFFTLLAAGIAFGVALVRTETRGRLFELLRSRWPTLLWCGVGAFALTQNLFAWYLATAEMMGPREWEPITRLIPRPWSWLLLGPSNLVYGGISRALFEQTGQTLYRLSVHAGGVGLLTMSLAVFGLWTNRRHTTVRILVPTMVVLVLFATVWPGGITLWRLFYDWVPGGGAVRAVGRISHVVLLLWAVGLALWTEDRGRRGMAPRRSGPRAMAANLLLPLVLLGVAGEQAHDPLDHDARSARERVRAVVEALPDSCGAFLLSSRGPSPFQARAVHEDAMWAALETGVPTINGRYGNDPPGWRLRQLHRPLHAPATTPSPRFEKALVDWLDHTGLDPQPVCWLEIDHQRGRVTIVRASPPGPASASGESSS